MTVSEKLFEEACRLMPGGVNSPVRGFGAVGGKPLFIAKARGAKIWDVDGNEYIDYVGSWGPAILGHAHPKVVAAVQEAAKNGFSFGAPTELENRLAGMVQQAFPSMERLRFVNSGTEATMSAIRLARGVTGRDKIIKFEGCYHGHADYLLVQAGSFASTFGHPTSAGVPKDFVKQTLVAPFNDLESVGHLFERNKGEVAGLIVEPIAGNMGCLPPQEGFLKDLQDLCKAYGALLIFDEVMTGFRVAFGGAQELYRIKPDLTCLGKIIGGGLPVGAYGGRSDFMEQVAPTGPVYQAGTLSGNPLAMTAGIKTLEQLSQDHVYEQLGEMSRKLISGLKEIAQRKNTRDEICSVGSMWSLGSDPKTFSLYFQRALKKGIYLPPSALETAFVSLAHKNAEIEETLRVFEQIMGEIG